MQNKYKYIMQFKMVNCSTSVKSLQAQNPFEPDAISNRIEMSVNSLDSAVMYNETQEKCEK